MDTTNGTTPNLDADPIGSFLEAVDDLREDDDTVRSTAHTASVSTDGWKTDTESADTAA
jgi:hypothetical protein